MKVVIYNTPRRLVPYCSSPFRPGLFCSVSFPSQKTCGCVCWICEIFCEISQQLMPFMSTSSCVVATHCNKRMFTFIQIQPTRSGKFILRCESTDVIILAMSFLLANYLFSLSNEMRPAPTNNVVMIASDCLLLMAGESESANSCVAGALTCVHSGGIIYIKLSRFTAQSRGRWRRTENALIPRQMFRQRKQTASAPLVGTTKQSFRMQSGTSQLSDRTRRRRCGRHYLSWRSRRQVGARLPARPSCIYSTSSECCAATVLETRNCFYRAALKYQRRWFACMAPGQRRRRAWLALCYTETEESKFTQRRRTGTGNRRRGHQQSNLRHVERLCWTYNV